VLDLMPVLVGGVSQKATRWTSCRLWAPTWVLVILNCVWPSFKIPVLTLLHISLFTYRKFLSFVFYFSSSPTPMGWLSILILCVIVSFYFVNWPLPCNLITGVLDNSQTKLSGYSCKFKSSLCMLCLHYCLHSLSVNYIPTGLYRNSVTE
jgi:phosphoglycerol transferase MdoB-like AlkP superfamily enzyme